MAMATATMSPTGKKAGTLVVVVMKAVFSSDSQVDLEKPPESPKDRKTRPVLHCSTITYGRTDENGQTRRTIAFLGPRNAFPYSPQRWTGIFNPQTHSIQ
jgi:hypothetical protein